MLAAGDDPAVTKLSQIRVGDLTCVGFGLSAMQSSKVQRGITLSQLIDSDLHALTIKSG